MNAHDLNHLIGCYALAMTMTVFKLSQWKVIITVTALGVGWECLDQLNHIFDWQILFLDARGFHCSDILMDLVGLILAVIVGMGIIAWKKHIE